MFSNLFLIDGPWSGKLAIAPAPAPGRSLEGALRGWQRLGVTGVLSMLDNERRGWEKEAEICKRIGLDFYSIPVMDHSVPPAEQMPEIASRLADVEVELQRGAVIVAHCYAGIGRSGMATVAMLMLGGVPLEEAVQRVSNARGRSCPETEEQHEWLRSFDRHRRVSYT